MDGAGMGLEAGSPVRVAAPAKINLALHVVGRRADGYHELDGLVSFAETGDELALSVAAEDSLTIVGAFANGVPAGPGNLVLKALALGRRIASRSDFVIPPLAIRLDKRLPVAAGIGGGSADAAALLRAIADAYPPLRTPLADAAIALGADVPMCLAGHPVRTRGIGERLDPVSMPALALVLVNPGVAVPTPAVFSAMTCRANAPLLALPDDGFTVPADVVAYLRMCRNDLEAPASTLFPSVRTALDALRTQDPALVRMSGSGGTVFGIFSDMTTAERAALNISIAHPDWWVAATRTIADRQGEPRHGH